MAISAAGVGSGLDINGIVTQLMALERRPVFQLEAKVSDYEAQLSAYGKIRSALSSFQTAMEGLSSLDKFQAYAAQSSDEDVLSASADSTVNSGNYAVEVIRLAQNHKLASSESLKTATYTGNLSIEVDSNIINIDTTGLTLEGIRDEINSNENNPGLTATIINTGGDNQRLILTAEESGDAKSILATGAGATALGLSIANRDKDGVLLGSTAELDAEFTIDGFTLNSASNEASEAIDGIKLNLNALGSTSLNVTRDVESIKESAQAFADAFNKLQSTLQDQSEDDLSGDSTVRNLQSSIRSVYNTSPSGLTGTFSSLAQIGFKTNVTSGEIEFDASDFEDALELDFEGVAQLFANDGEGYAFRLASFADSLLDPNGAIDSREQGIRSNIDYDERRILSLEARLELTETRLRAKYASLDSLIGSMQGTMQFVASLG